jgi:serine/threonine protein kinase
LLLDKNSGTIKVTDFGLATVLDELSGGVEASAVLGTPMYMSPEQVTGHTLDHRTDIYSLGVTLFTMITGEEPFLARNFAELAQHHLESPVPDVDHVPPAVLRVIGQMMAKLPANRFQDYHALEAALERMLKSPFVQKAGRAEEGRKPHVHRPDTESEQALRSSQSSFESVTTDSQLLNSIESLLEEGQQSDQTEE